MASQRWSPAGILGREVLQARAAAREALVNRALSFWRANGFPYPRLTKQEEAREFELLCAVSGQQVIRQGYVVPTTLGLRLANSFHPQMWRIPAHRHKRSPLDYFEDDDVLRSLLERAPRFWPNRTCWNAQCLRALFRVYGGGRVANFRPTAAKALIERFSGLGDTILDFSAGFGGRLLGCLPLDRQFVGIEPAATQVRGLRQMTRVIGERGLARVQLLRGCAEEILPELPPRSVAMVFSSPPYFNLERYSEDSTQSSRRYSRYRDWLTHFLRPIVEGAHHVLGRGDVFVMNVADVSRYPIATDLRRMVTPMFRVRETLRLTMHARPLQRATGSPAYRWEPVFAFSKR